MRRLLLAIPLIIATPCLAQTQGSPVEAFSFGARVGTQSNPLMAALSSVVPSAHASTQAAAPVELFSYGQRVGTPGNPIYINLGNALAPYLTQSQAAQTYLPLSGGTVQTLAVGTTFSPPVMTYAQATGSQCTEGTVAYVRDAQKFGSNAPANGSAANSPIYSYTGGAAWGGMLFLCTRLGGNPAWVGLTFNQSTGPAQQ